MKSSNSEETNMQKCQSEESIRIPKILDPKVEPLFSLPSNLLSLKKHKRKEEEPSRPKEKFRQTSYTAKRIREEKFRRYKEKRKKLSFFYAYL